jgi:hypothetical protein
MTKKLEEILDIDKKEETIRPPSVDAIPLPPVITLEEKLEEFDKIAAALPRVKGLGDISDQELDHLAKKAEDAYDDIMDLAMQVEPRYSTRMFEVATGMLTAAITAKTNKIDKKLKMVDLQLKKLAIDKKSGEKGDEVAGEGYILTDRNSILEKLKNMNK